MAFPTIQTADTKLGTQTSNSTSWTLTYPSNIAAGNLLLAFVATDGIPNLTFPAGWQLLIAQTNGATANRLFVYGKIATGAETGTFSMGLDATEQGAWRIYRLTGWFGTTNLTDGTAVAYVGGSTGSPSQFPDPPSLNPSGWDVEDTLWFTALSVDTSRTITIYPSNMGSNQTSDVSGGSTGATLALATANSTTASFDPSGLTISASDDWAAATVAVRPRAPVPPSTNAGTQPAPSGALTASKITFATVGGTQPTPSATKASDSFNRADNSSSLGTSSGGQVWSALSGTWGIGTNTGKNFSATANQEVAVLETGVADGSYFVALAVPGAGADMGVIVRAIDDSNYLLVNQGNLFKKDAGSFTSLAGLSPGIGGGATREIRVDLLGASLKVYVDGVLALDYTLTGGNATKYTSPTKVGIREHGATHGAFDNLSFVESTGSAGTVSFHKTGLHLTVVGTQPQRGSPVIADDFNRADNALTLGSSSSGHPWTPGAGIWGITSNQARPQDPATGVHVATLDAGIADGDLVAEVTQAGATHAAVIFRGIDASNYLIVGSFALFKVEGGGTALFAYSTWPAGVHQVRVNLLGPRIRAYLDEVPLFDYTLSGANATKFTTPTQVGMYTDTNVVGPFDNLAFLGSPGALSRVIQPNRSLSGIQPSASGTLTRVRAASRSLQGRQVAMKASFSDTFDRANNSSSLGTATPGPGGWGSQVGTWGIASNQAQSFSATPNRDIALATSIQVRNGELSLDVDWNGAPGVVVNYTAGNRYLFVADSWLWKNDGGVFTQLVTFPTGMSGFAVCPVRVVIDYPTYTVYYNDELMGSYTLSGAEQLLYLVPNYVGLYEHSTSKSLFNNFLFLGTTPATLSASKQSFVSLTGAQPAATGTLTSFRLVLRSQSGAQPAATGTLSRKLTALRSLSGSQPAATGTLSRKLTTARSVSGAQPSSTGLVARLLQTLRPVSGSQPAGAGTLLALKVALRNLAGSQPAGTGTLARLKSAQRSQSGAQPSASGLLTRVLTALRVLAGMAGVPAGSVTRQLQAKRALNGLAPAPSGTLTAQSLVTTRTATVPFSAALATTGVRTVPLSATTGAFLSRAVPLSVALSQTTSRVVPLGGALQGTTTRLVPFSVALGATGVRTVPLSAATGALLARTVPLSLALSATSSRAVLLSVALSVTASRTVPLTASIALTYVRSVPLTATLSLSLVRAVPLTVALSGTGVRTVPLTTVLGSFVARTVPLSVALGATFAREVPLDTALAAQQTCQVSLSASLWATEVRSVPLTVVLANTESRVVPLSGTITDRFILEDVDSPTRSLVAQAGEPTTVLVGTSVLVATGLPVPTTPELIPSGATRASILPGGYP